MAFLSRFGNILRQTANKQIGSELAPLKLSINQAVRCMSSMGSSKLFVGGISYQTDEHALRETFSKYGEVVDARIIMDRETNRPRGFGFITFTTSEEASSAIQALDGKDLDGRRVRVNYANNTPRNNFMGGDGSRTTGGGGYAGGYGNDNYNSGGGNSFGTASGGGYTGDGGYANNTPRNNFMGGAGSRTTGGGGYAGGYGNENYNSGGGNSFGTASGGGYAGDGSDNGGYGNDSYNSGGGNSFGTASGGAFGDNFGVDNFGLGGGDNSFPTGGSGIGGYGNDSYNSGGGNSSGTASGAGF